MRYFWFCFFGLVASTISDPNSSSRSSFLFLPFFPLSAALVGFGNPDALCGGSTGLEKESLRVGPDGEPNSSLADFRWSVNQLTVQGPGEGPQEVPVPDRGDLIRSLRGLLRREPGLDGILIETTGMADPGPVAQTFFMDDEVKEKLGLDAIVTLVDARHVLQHIDSDECHAQIAFADVLLLNKRDLVSDAELAVLERRMRDINRMAAVYDTQHGVLDLDRILGIRAFDLQARAAETPDLLKEELPFEWAGIFALQPGSYTLHLEPGPDPGIDLVLAGPGVDRPGAFDQLRHAVTNRGRYHLPHDFTAVGLDLHCSAQQ